jgi:hypothetical protein
MATPIVTRSDWLKANPPSAMLLDQTLADLAQRVRVGEDFNHVVREFLDEYSLRGDDRLRSEAIVRTPTLPPWRSILRRSTACRAPLGLLSRSGFSTAFGSSATSAAFARSQ